MGSEQQEERGGERRKRWGGCLSAAVSCFGGGSQHKGGGKRIVPASRSPADGGVAASAAGQQAQAQLLAPPSSPASLSQSGLPSTAQSPSSSGLMGMAMSPVGPTNTMFVTGPYAHETQLVSPPVFSTFTTQPSTAPLTPPLERTTPSSPDVPYARCYVDDSNFFCPATFAQFYLDNPPFPNTAGRLSVSKDADAAHHHPPPTARGPTDPDEMEAYRASFGFSADEIVTTPHYVEITAPAQDSFCLGQPDPTLVVVTGLKPLKTPANMHKHPHGEKSDDDDDDIFAKMGSNRNKFHHHHSDAEVDYRRGRSLRDSWHPIPN